MPIPRLSCVILYFLLFSNFRLIFFYIYRFNGISGKSKVSDNFTFVSNIVPFMTTDLTPHKDDHHLPSFDCLFFSSLKPCPFTFPEEGVGPDASKFHRQVQMIFSHRSFCAFDFNPAPGAHSTNLPTLAKCLPETLVVGWAILNWAILNWAIFNLAIFNWAVLNKASLKKESLYRSHLSTYITA